MNFIAHYHCHDGCHTFLVAGPERRDPHAMVLVRIIPREQPEAIINLQAEHAHFSAQTWAHCYARIVDEEWQCMPPRQQSCWAAVIRHEAKAVIPVELRSVPLWNPAYGI